VTNVQQNIIIIILLTIRSMLMCLVFIEVFLRTVLLITPTYTHHLVIS